MSRGKCSPESPKSCVSRYRNRVPRGIDRSDGPGFLGPAHLPEHPLVPARRPEVAVYSGPLIFGKAVRNAVQLADHIGHDIAVLVAAVGGNPALVTRIRGAAADELLANGGINPVARQDRADSFGIDATPDGGLQVTGIGGVRRGGLGTLQHFHGNSQLVEKRAV